jgi:hypothetical protein
MPRLPRTNTTELNVVVSGNKRTVKQAIEVLAEAGFAQSETRRDDWGLPSYVDPLEAEKAGKPNAGHTPGTPHPGELHYLIFEGDHAELEECAEGCDHVGLTEPRQHVCKYVGKPYAKDERIAFVGFTLDCELEAMSEAVTKADHVITPLGWQLRAYWESPAKSESKVPMEERLAHIEAALGLKAS